MIVMITAMTPSLNASSLLVGMAEIVLPLVGAHG
jgi:hypothetical protein